jgi:uncharacterized protein (DUF488 family)
VASDPTLVTVGHGTASQDALVELFAGAGITLLVDIRRFPASRRQPHVAREQLAAWLPEHGVVYRWESRLGGRRQVAGDAPQADPWWQVEAFRAYAAHMRSTEFGEAMAQLLDDVRDPRPGRTAVMCSETVWWRCHRRLVADAVVLLHGTPVLHLAHDGRLTPHPPAPGARVAPDGLWYDVVAPSAQH